ncbi:hypothetical protein FRC07_008216 [Ceratobasidium sp. 392]|nr:hypothetical protein FRC07_008216 [Ceratobasidium sp. 392]
MSLELIIQSPQQQSERSTGRACEFSYNRESKIITASAPLADEISDSDSDGVSLSSPMSERSFPELVQQEFVLELMPQKHHSTVARLWNYYVIGSKEDEEQSQQDTEKANSPVLSDLAADGSWHRRRNIRLVAGKDMSGCYIQQATVFQQWDIIPLR